MNLDDIFGSHSDTPEPTSTKETIEIPNAKKMKVAVVKLGGTVSENSSATSGGIGEALSIIKILNEANVDVHLFTKKLQRGKSESSLYKFHDIEEEYLKINELGFDALIVINGNLNFFGGNEDRAQILIYHLINTFKGKVFYFLCDAALVLNQVWPSIEKKEWGTKYQKSDILITREDLICVSQARDVNRVKLNFKTKQNFSSFVHFPFEKFPLLTLKQNYDITKEFDLLYGGTFRGGRRADDMVKFLFGYPSEEVNVHVFGKITADDFKTTNQSHPSFGKSVAYNEYHEFMKKGLSTIIIGDTLYKELDNLAQRIYESIRVGNILFIDATYDHNKRVFENEELRKFCYVNSRQDIQERIRYLKANPEKIEYFQRLQVEDQKFCKRRYAHELLQIMEKHIYE